MTSKRWSGHNNMEITPSNADWNLLKNWTHFYMMLAIIPASVLTTILGIRANPELSEVPDGYEPRIWEYYKHPITRWMVRYMYVPMEREHELMMGYFEWDSEVEIMTNIIKKVDKVMKFYHDHRSYYFLPFFADYFRQGREDADFCLKYEGTNFNTYYDAAYDPDVAAVPTQGYPEGPPKV